MEPSPYRGHYRVGVIGDTGHGNYGHNLDMAFWGLANVELVAVADPDAAGRQRAAERTGAARQYVDYHDLLEVEHPDAVVVATRWPELHGAMITAAVRSGVKGILSEKPLAPSLDVADRLAAACDARGVKLAVAHHNRVRQAAPFVRDLIAGGKIGRLRMIRAFGKQDQRSGGEDLLVLGIHLTDLMRYFAGNAQWCDARVTVDGRDATARDVSASQTEQLGPIAGDAVTAFYGFDDGVMGTFESTRAADGGGTPCFHIELCGSAGILAFWSDPDSEIYLCAHPYALPGDAAWQALPRPAIVEPADAPATTTKFFASNRALASDLLAAIEENRPPVANGYDAVAALEMVMAVYEAHGSGQRVRLPLAERTHPLDRWTGVGGQLGTPGGATSAR